MAGILAAGMGACLCASHHGALAALDRTSFPASDQLLRNEIAKEGEKALGIKLTIETINANDIQARVTSAIQSGSGPDVVCVLNNWGQLYGESVIDVSDIAEELGKGQGGFYETSRAVANDGKKWIAVPWCIVGLQIAYRKSWFAEIGYTDGKFPQTWEEYREAGKKLKAKGRPIGQTLSHTFGDAPAFTYPYLWSWGGKEVEADGKTVVLNSPATVESVSSWWPSGRTPTMKAVSPGTIPTTTALFCPGRAAPRSMAPRSTIEALRKPDTYKTEAGGQLKDDILHAALPKGPGGQFSYHVPFSNLLMGYSKNHDAAKKIPWLDSLQGRLQTSGSSPRRASRSARPRIGKSTSCGATTRSCCPTSKRRAQGASLATKGPLRARQPRS